uniref:Uncharacterized protein n=1 Tax=Siphoviridae sp. ct4sp3 TaxID=2825332 RepID=A0A8S5PT80_9CAUD|nr:MAG TPA: hypothetical protein [Siphoviridae sp. ct4sp3]
MRLRGFLASTLYATDPHSADQINLFSAEDS